MESRALSGLFILLLVTTACSKRLGFQAIEVPREKARLQDLQGGGSDQDEDLYDDSQYDDDEAPGGSSNRPSTHSLAEMAQWVVENESRKIPAACNIFIQRVLFLMGFGKGQWVANDFDSYVEENFQTYQKRTFRYDPKGEAKKELKKYIWSFPERTGFIFQWKRNAGHGHIAIVQRIGEDLVIYHASLNRFRPKAQKATLDLFLYRSGSSADVLNVFSDFKKPRSKAG